MEAWLGQGSSIKYVRKIYRKAFLTPWYIHVRVRIRGLEMLAFRKILRMYLMIGPLQEIRNLISSRYQPSVLEKREALEDFYE